MRGPTVREWLGLSLVLSSACRQQVGTDEMTPRPREVVQPAEPETRVGQVFRQCRLPPPSQWRVSPAGDRVTAALDSGCGVWDVDSMFLGTTTDPGDAAACERWPTLVAISGTSPPTPLVSDALPADARIHRLWSEPQRRWFVAEYTRARGNGTGGFIFWPDGSLTALRWIDRPTPQTERVSARWYDAPSPTYLALSLVSESSWTGHAMRIDPVEGRSVDELPILVDSWAEPEVFEIVGPTDGRPSVRVDTCAAADDDEAECVRTEPTPPSCEPIGGWSGYWILACEDSEARFVVDHPNLPELDRARARRPLPGLDRGEVEWVGAEGRLAWWSKSSGLVIYDSDELEFIAELPEVTGLHRATLDSELGRALVHTDAGMAILELETGQLGPSLPASGPITAAAFAPDRDAVAVGDGEQIHVWRLSTNDARSWAAADLVKLAWRQDTEVLFGSSDHSKPERAWDPDTGNPVELLAPELRARIEAAPARFDPTWRWVIVEGSQTGSVDFIGFVEIVRTIDGLALYVSYGGELNGGSMTPSGLYQPDSAEWFLDQWRVGFGRSPLAPDWRVETLTDHAQNARADLVTAFFAGQPLTAPSW